MILIKVYFGQQENQNPSLGWHFAKHSKYHLKSGQSQVFICQEIYTHFLDKYLGNQRLKAEKLNVSEKGTAIHPGNLPVPASGT